MQIYKTFCILYQFAYKIIDISLNYIVSNVVLLFYHCNIGTRIIEFENLKFYMKVKMADNLGLNGLVVSAGK